MSIIYDKATRTKAERQGVDLFACGARQLRGDGCRELCAPMPLAMGEALVLFCLYVTTGDSPADAFAAVGWPEAAPKPAPEYTPPPKYPTRADGVDFSRPIDGGTEDAS